jgi:hypothetical protein
MTQSSRASLLAVGVEIDGCALRFETDRAEARERLDRFLASTLVGGYYEYAITPPTGDPPVATLRYLDRKETSARLDRGSNTCVFSAPWSEIGETSVLVMWLFYLSESARQQRGEYLLHAAAVARGGRAIVLVGPSGSGKTTGALDLCLTEGFELVANNRVKVAVADGCPRVLKGDAVFNVGSNSLRRYSEPLWRRVFADVGEEGPGPAPKRAVAPEVLGVKTAPPGAAIDVVAFIGLDAEAAPVTARRISCDIRSHDAFRAVSALYQEMSGLVRGTTFMPFALRAGSEAFFVPSLDQPEFMRGRVAFLEALFAASQVVRIVAPLRHAVGEVVRLLTSSSAQP